MTSEARSVRNRQLCDGYVRALAIAPEIGRVEFPADWVVGPDTIQWLPAAMGTGEHQLGVHLAEQGVTHSERGTAEFQKFWKLMPDFGLVAHGEPIVGDSGFAVWIRLEGTTADGTKVGLWEFDLVHTDQDGVITRYEAMFDMGELQSLLAVAIGETTGQESMEEIRAKLK